MSKRTAYDRSELGHPTTKRAKQVDADPPYDHLTAALHAQKPKDNVSKVVHWFRSKDLRIQDNIALYNACSLAKESGKPLACIYLNCPAELSWHGTSPARVDFMLETLALMQAELKKLNIPLVFLQADERNQIVPTVVKFLDDNSISHLFANYEYEVDELRRDTKLLKQVDSKVHVSMHHDQTVMEPGTMLTGGGKPMKVFTPYHQAWLGKVKANPKLLATVPPPEKNDASASKELKSLFGSKVPGVAKDKQFSSNEERDRVRKLWPAGHHAGVKRLDEFIHDKIEDYAATRSQPAAESTSRMSAYFSAGMVSVREALSKVMEYNSGSSDFGTSGASAGVASWVREIVFRELYRQTTLTTPHTVMNMPQNLKFDFVKWETDEEGWKKWHEGKTGVPFVDAGMRQLNHEAYMHNRLRMNVSSYLYCNLLIDYRRGERYFAETLIDWDLSNNTQGWEPSYTVFNPVSQAEKNDRNGDYIRKWVPELKDVKGKAVFAPHARLSKAEFDKLGYPRPHVDWNETKARVMERFKRDMKDAEP
jgi:deoxyribodipyrimidine photo-lyase